MRQTSHQLHCYLCLLTPALAALPTAVAAAGSVRQYSQHLLLHLQLLRGQQQLVQ
jgi:hypothetical protein